MTGPDPHSPRPDSRGRDTALRVTVAALRRRRRALGRLAAWSSVEALPALLTGYVTAHAVDDGFLAGRPAVGLAWLGALAVAVGIGAVGTGRVYTCLADVVEPFRDDLVRRVVAGALRRSTGPAARPDTAAVARLTQQVEIVRDTCAGLVMVVRGFLFACGAALVGLLSLAPVVAALVAAPLVVGLALLAAALPAMVTRQREYVRAGERLGQAVSAALTGHRDVVACGGEDAVVADVGRRIDAQAGGERALARMAALRGLSLAVGGWLPLVVLLVAAPWLVRRGLTPGAVLGALVYVSTGLQPALHSLVQTVTGGGLRYAVTLSRILRASAPPHQPSVPVGLTRSPGGVVGGASDAGSSSVNGVVDVPAAGWSAGPQPDGRVELRGVTFRYGPEARPVLDRFDLSLSDGDHLVIVGPSGAGKSTLAALIAGTLPPDAGVIRLAGRPTADAAPAALARLRVLVPQEAYVFAGTVAENLRYLDPDADDQAVSAAVRRLGGDALLRRLGGLDGWLDPASLSAGERQLVAAIRAYLSPAPIAILDEATCHLGPTTEARIEQAFAARPGTLIVVAHRITSALRAQRVLILDGATPVLGSHEEVLRRSPTYRELVGHWAAEDEAARASPAPRCP